MKSFLDDQDYLEWGTLPSTHARASNPSAGKLLLNATALQIATGGRATVFDSLQIQDPTLLGGSRFRRAKFTESDDAQLDWHFQILVQAWASANKLGPVRDLREESRFNAQACGWIQPAILARVTTTERLKTLCACGYPERAASQRGQSATKCFELMSEIGDTSQIGG